LETTQAPVAEITSPEGVQTPRRREQLSRQSSEALGSIENLMRSVASPHASLDLPHRRFAQARRLDRLSVETDPIVDLR